MSTRRHILIVDNDRRARFDLVQAIAPAGFAVTEAATAAEVWPILQRRGNRIDLALIDTALPDGDGRELVSRLRRRGMVLPLILLSELASEDDVVWGLEAGADDYLVRPLRPREVVARMRAQFRTAGSREEGDIAIGPVVFRPGSRTLLHPDMPCAVRLTEKESALLMRLCRAEGRPVSRQSLLNEVWGYSPDASSHTVETHIYRLRRKIEPQPNSPGLLVNEGGGYRLCMTDPIAREPEAPRVAHGFSPRLAPSRMDALLVAG